MAVEVFNQGGNPSRGVEGSAPRFEVNRGVAGAGEVVALDGAAHSFGVVADLADESHAQRIGLMGAVNEVDSQHPMRGAIGIGDVEVAAVNAGVERVGGDGGGHGSEVEGVLLRGGGERFSHRVAPTLYEQHQDL